MPLKAGKLGAIDVPLNADAVLYRCGAAAGDAGSTATAATATVSLCNRGTNTATVRLAIGPADAAAVADYIEYGVALAAGGVLERSGIVVSAGERIIVRSDVATVSARAHGFER